MRRRDGRVITILRLCCTCTRSSSPTVEFTMHALLTLEVIHYSQFQILSHTEFLNTYLFYVLRYILYLEHHFYCLSRKKKQNNLRYKNLESTLVANKPAHTRRGWYGKVKFADVMSFMKLNKCVYKLSI